MKTPAHWNKTNITSIILSPIGKIFGLITSLRIKLSHPKSVKNPVICVGNLTAGGTGKTPVSISLSKILKKLDYSPFFVSRGYGGKLKNIIVNPQKHSAEDVGDEPLLLSEHAPVSINPNRFEAAELAIKNGADIIIMDDGFQNPGLKKDISFLVFDGTYGIGNGFCIPAGPLRESFSSGIKRANALIIIGNDKQNLSKKTTLPVFHASISPIKPKDTPQDIIAFAGIGRPEKFYTSLKDLGFNLVKTFDFPDHHKYTPEDLQTLISFGKSHNTPIFTTGKDMVKIPTDLRKNFQVLEIEIKWENESQLTSFLKNKLS